MATLGAGVLTLTDWAKGLDPNGKTARTIGLLNMSNPILKDLPFKEGNLATGERIVQDTSLPSVFWRLMNNGVAPSKGTTAQMDEQCGMLEAWSEVDKDLAELNGDIRAFRLSYARKFIEAMNQEMAQTLFYGNSGTAPEEFTGLSVRYSSTTAGNGQNVLLGGGAGSDNASVWLIGWGDQSVYGIYPKGSEQGLIHDDLGLVTVETTAGIAGNRMRAYQDRWQWKCGIALADWRYAVRIANIDISALIAKSSAADLIELMITAIHRIPNLEAVNPVFYMNRTCFQMLDIQRRDDAIAGGGIRYDLIDGKIIYTFRGIPIRPTDGLTIAEGLVA